MCDPYPSNAPLRQGAGKDNLEFDNKKEDKDKWLKN